MKITNIGTTPVALRTLAVTLDPSEEITAYRTPSDLMNFRDLYQLVQSGVVSFVITPTADELAAGFTPYPGLSAAAASTLAALGTLPSSALPDGTSVWVEEYEDFYVLDTTVSHTANNLSVIAAADGGYWISRMVGRWTDQQGDVRQAAAVAAMTVEVYRDTLVQMAFFRHDQNDQPSFSYQFSHAWMRNAVKPHIHIYPMANASGDVVFDLEWAWGVYEEELPARASWSTSRVIFSITAAMQYKKQIVGFGDFTPPSSAKESSFLFLSVQRSGLDAADTYTGSKSPGTPAANVGLAGADVHYRTNKLGTEQDIPT